MFEISTIIVILGTFLIGGLVKGVIGWGLPSISLAILTVFTNLPTSIVLMLAPSLVTNIWQATMGGKFSKILLRLSYTYLILMVLRIQIMEGMTSIFVILHIFTL